jgi:hypothetical protein
MLTLTINAKMPPIFTQCVQIVESGLISVLASCCWGDVEIRCRVTRQLVVWLGMFF